MKISELAKELNTNSETILATLRSFKLKAKDSTQDLSPAVVSVVRSQILKMQKIAGSIPPKTKPTVTATEEMHKSIKEKESISPALNTAPQDITTKPKPKVATHKSSPAAIPKKTIPPIKPRITIGMEPIITLKPLVRKKRKITTLPVGKGDSMTSVHAPTLPSAAPIGGIVLPVAADVTTESTLVELEINTPITVKDFSARIQQKPSVVLKSLMYKGILAHINQGLDSDIVDSLAKEFGYKFIKIRTQEEQLIEAHRKEEESPALLKPRACVVTFMGHVDHGKTSLLDCIRKSKVTDTEHGGITQHIGAYSVQLPKGRITFLDTPGHEAFTAMRARGAHITDIVVLVVAADEGIMPQTEEAINHARAANVPIVVALNKIDRKNADPDRVKKQLADIGLTPEEWQGKTVVVGVSALTGQGVDQLLELILLETELLELKANADKKASGIVVEAHLSPGKGAVITLIVQNGTLREGETIVVGPYFGRVRAMMDDHGRTVLEAGPSMPVEVLGLSDVPDAGELFYVSDDERQAREISFKRQEERKNRRLQATSRITLEDIYAQIQKGQIKELNVILKADVQGSLGALKDSLEKIPSDKVKLKFIHLGVGDVNASDVILAVASRAIIIAFHVDIDPRAKQELDKEPVDIRQYRIIYDAVNDIRKALEGLLEAKTKKIFLGRVEIRQVFKLSKGATIAGCYVTKGRVNRKDKADILRNGEPVFSGAISTLKRFKDDVREINEGVECGISFTGFDQFQSGDIIEVYEIEKIAQKL